MARIAVLVDLSFFLRRYRYLARGRNQPLSATNAAKALLRTAQAHVHRNADELHRILVYDCQPLAKKAFNPITRRTVDFSRTDLYRFRSELYEQLVCLRKVALRMGELADRHRWRIREEPTRLLLAGTLRADELLDEHIVYDVQQKGVDIKMGIDIAALAYKRLVDRIVLITGDADFVPAAKLARREGLDVVLDPLWASISPSLNEHIDGLRASWPRPKPHASPDGSARSPVRVEE